MYRSSSIKYIKTENSVFRWGYLCTSTSKAVRKFKMIARFGVPQADWVNGRAWSSPIVPNSPPEGV